MTTEAMRDLRDLIARLRAHVERQTAQGGVRDGGEQRH